MIKNKIVFSTLITFCLLLFSCDFFKSDMDRFVHTYRKVLINTEINAFDSLKARKELMQILDKDGYTLESFQEQFMKIVSENPENLTKILDTMRQSVAKEIIEIKRKSN